MTEIATAKTPFEGFWTSLAGQRAAAWLDATFLRHSRDTVGFYAIQLGLPQLPLVEHLRVRWRWIIAPESGDLRAYYEHLPLASNSIDCVIAPFTWSYARDPFAVLREIDRVLVPEGRLFVAGLNPLSPLRACGGWPRSLAMIAVSALRDHLRLLGFEVRTGAFGGYTPFSASSIWNRWELAAQRWFAVCGAYYFIEAIKRVPGIRLIEPNWRQQLQLRALRLGKLAQSSISRH